MRLILSMAVEVTDEEAELLEDLIVSQRRPGLVELSPPQGRAFLSLLTGACLEHQNGSQAPEPGTRRLGLSLAQSAPPPLRLVEAIPSTRTA